MTDSVEGLGGFVRDRARMLGFGLVGITDAEGSDHQLFLRRWLAADFHGDMGYLARPDAVERRAGPRHSWAEARSVVVVGHVYGENGEQAESPAHGIIARYARGRDYHKVVKSGLRRLLSDLQTEVGHRRGAPVDGRVFVDTGPLLEREVGRRAGLGWFGRNTMLIHPRGGSYFLLGALLLNVDLAVDEPYEPDRCGSCRACLDACPTGALLGRDADGAPVMDARRCISYLTIESRGAIPEEFREAMGNRVFGCDICQEVCPFNGRLGWNVGDPAYAARGPGERPAGVEPDPTFEPAWHPGTEAPALVDLLETALDETAWDSFSRGSALRRAGRAGFARNVCVALGNWGSPEAVPVLTLALSDTEPLVRAHAAWALGRVGSAESSEALSSRLSAEPDESVRSELAAALAS